jgi:hypothetical protein
MSEAERFCDEKTTVLIPSIALNYDGNMLESVGIGGEMFRRETPLNAENTRLKAENAKLRELVDAWMGCGTRYHTMQGGCPMFDESAKDFCKAEEIARELGIEVGE